MKNEVSNFNEIEYNKWISELSAKYKRSQIKASISVNSEMLRYYWELGKEISEQHFESKWGTGFFDRLSKDLKNEIPNAKCFSPRNLRYMKKFYELFGLEESNKINLPQLGAKLYSIPWGHIKLLVDKFGKERNYEKAIFL